MVIKQAAFIFPREHKSVQEFAIQWKMGDYGNGSLRLIFTALYISKGLLILRVLLPLQLLLQSSTQASSTDGAPAETPC